MCQKKIKKNYNKKPSEKLNIICKETNTSIKLLPSATGEKRERKPTQFYISQTH